MEAPLPIPQTTSAVYNPLKDLYLYVRDERQDIKDLERRLSKLINDVTIMQSRREIIDQILETSPSKERIPASEVIITNINDINSKYMEFIDKYTKLTGNHLSPTSPSSNIERLSTMKSKVISFNFRKLARLSRRVSKLSTRALAAAENLKPEDMIQNKARPNQQTLDGDDNVILSVIHKSVDEIMELMFDDGYNKVGVFGKHGAGKTTVLRNLYNRLLGDHESRVVWLREGSETVENLQNEMMEQLGINRNEVSKSRVMNANTISTSLCKERYVLLIDHVSERINLEDLGVKKTHEYKVVICSTEKKLLDEMTESRVEIRGLENGEALELIESICGRLHGYKRDIAKRIIECCEGIPFLIRSVAMGLKYKEDDRSWNYVKETLQSKPKSRQLIDLGIYEKVYEIKYQGLTADAKKCLLYGALFPLRHRICTDYLVECWIAEGFIVEEAAQKVRANREYGQMILHNLTEECLLRWYSGQNRVMMQPTFRRVALVLDYPDGEECVNWVFSDKGEPKDSSWETVTRMSLIGCEMDLPESPECSNICTLLLQLSKHEADRLPDSFFAHMGSLKVLDLNQTGITMLPGSIKELVNLKTLYLNGCDGLVTLPPEAARLVELEFLDISGTSISTLPEEIKYMVNMRCLRASLSAKQVVNFEGIIPPGIISNLRNLEELSIVTDFDFHGGNGIAEAENLATELATLEHLNTLCFNFPNESSLNKFLTHRNALKHKEIRWKTQPFRSFKIFIGCHETRRSHEQEFSEMLDVRWLRYSTNEKLSPPCEELLKHTTALEIIGHHLLSSFTGSQFDLDSVEVCVVESCNLLENIVDNDLASENQRIAEQSQLRKLYLYDLKLLNCIWMVGTVPPTSLVNLTALTVDGCPELTKILDLTLAKSLQSLEYLKVDNCCKISKIIEGSGETSAASTVEPLIRLKMIELSNLPELKCICEDTRISWKSLKFITVMGCSKLRSLSLTHTSPTKLPLIQCEESWWKTLAPDENLKKRASFFKEETVQGGTQSRREEASTSASRRSELTTAASSMVIRDYEEASIGASGRSELTTAASSMVREIEEETTYCSNLAAIDNHQPLDHDPGSSSYVTESRGEKKLNKGCFPMLFGS